MKVILEKTEYNFGETLQATIEGVQNWAAVILKDPTTEGNEVHGSPVLLAQSGLPNQTPTSMSLKLAWGGIMSGVVTPGFYLLRVWGYDSGNVQSESDSLIKVA